MCSESIITKQFLEKIFCKDVTNFTCKEGSKPGDNYLSKIYSLNVTLKGDDKSVEVQNIIIKFYPDNEAKREFLDSVSLFETEYLVYRELLPGLNSLAEEVNRTKANENEPLKQFGFSTAKFYGGNIVGSNAVTSINHGPWVKENFLILEDIRMRSPPFRMLDRTKGLVLQHCLLTVDQLANLHALSWVYKKRYNLNSLVDKHPYLKDAFYRIENEAGWRPVVENMNKAALEVIQNEFGAKSDISQGFESLLEKDVMAIIRMFLSWKGVNELEAEILLRVKMETEPSYGEPWLVTTHGDCWISNLLFSADEVIAVDFQAFREACLTTDLAYFLYSSTSPSLRNQSINLILESYFNKFVDICSTLEEVVPEGFTLENLKRRWRRARIYALLLSVQFITFIHKTESKQEENPEINNANGTITQAYADVVQSTEGNLAWRNQIIDTVKMEFEDGII